MVFNEQLICRRKQLGLSQEQLGEKIGVTRQTVSKWELGVALLKRSRAGVRLTGEGERLLPAVRSLLAAAEQLEQTASSIRGLDSGTVRIGAFTSVAPQLNSTSALTPFFFR